MATAVSILRAPHSRLTIPQQTRSTLLWARLPSRSTHSYGESDKSPNYELRVVP